MARIITYNLDSEVNSVDKLIGTDGKPGSTYGSTKNYSFSQLAAYFTGGTGSSGASAYDIWLSEGNTGTIQDFLNSLVGAAGAQGPTGAAGANGTNGTNGVDGQDGVQGEPGADGTSINIQGTKPTVGDLPLTGTLGDLWIIDTTGGGATAGDGYVWTAENTWLNIGPLRGPQGIQGVAGVNGADGADGANGAQGPQGIQGIQGPQGLQGIQGLPGADGTITENLTGVTPVLCNNAGVEFAGLTYLEQSCRMTKTEISNTSNNYLITFDIQVAIQYNTALYSSSNAIGIKLDSFPYEIFAIQENFRIPMAADYQLSSKTYTPINFYGLASDNLIKIIVDRLNGNSFDFTFQEGFTADYISSTSIQPLIIYASGSFWAK